MYLIKNFGLSIRRACPLIGIWRTSFAYNPKEQKPDEAAIKIRLKEPAQ